MNDFSKVANASGVGVSDDTTPIGPKSPTLLFAATRGIPIGPYNGPAGSTPTNIINTHVCRGYSLFTFTCSMISSLGSANPDDALIRIVSTKRGFRCVEYQGLITCGVQPSINFNTVADAIEIWASLYASALINTTNTYTLLYSLLGQV